MSNRSYAELMESLQADLTNKTIVEKSNPAEEKHYLNILENSYNTFLETFTKYLNSSIVAKHSDVIRLHESAQKMKEQIREIESLISLKDKLL